VAHSLAQQAGFARPKRLDMPWNETCSIQGAMLSRWVGLLAIGIGMAALGCSGDDGDEREERHETLDRALQSWRTKAPASYVFVQAYSCFCADTLPARIVVENGRVVSATLSNGMTASAERALTIDGYFGVVEDWIDRNPDKLAITYDQSWGFPAQVDADFHSDGIDDEKSMSISCFAQAPFESNACPPELR
jgi:hypothetical protein